MTDTTGRKKKPTPSARGGTRPGAGRRPLDDGMVSELVKIRAAPADLERIKTELTPTERAAACLAEIDAPRIPKERDPEIDALGAKYGFTPEDIDAVEATRAQYGITHTSREDWLIQFQLGKPRRP